MARYHGRRLRAGAQCRASSRLQLNGARAASGPLGGRVAPPLAGVTLLPCELGAVHAADNKIGNDGARALAASLEKNRTLTMLGLEGAQLCASDGWGGGACGAVSRPAAARGRTMQSELALAVERRACGVGSPWRARGSSSCRRDAFAV